MIKSNKQPIDELNALNLKMSEPNFRRPVSLAGLHRGVPKKEKQRHLQEIITLTESKVEILKAFVEVTKNIETDCDIKIVITPQQSEVLIKRYEEMLVELNEMRQDIDEEIDFRELLTKLIGGLVSGISYILTAFRMLANMCYKIITACFTKICDTLSQAASFVKKSVGITGPVKEQSGSIVPSSSESFSTVQKTDQLSVNNTADEDPDFNRNPNTTQRL